MYCFQSFLKFIKDYQNACNELSKCSTFSKRVSNSNKYDLVCFCSNEGTNDQLFAELVNLIEESKLKALGIQISFYHNEKNRIFLKLVRSSVIKAVFYEIFDSQSDFGNTTIFNGKTFQVGCDESERGLTNLRTVTGARIVAALISRGGGIVTTTPRDGAETIWLGPTRAGNESKNHFILVNHASVSGASNMSQEDFKQLRRRDMLVMGCHKDITESSLTKIVDAAVTFDLLSIKLEKPIVLDSSSQPKSARKSNCKGAPFVLYNYARLCVILERYNHGVANSIYKPLHFKDINYDLLSDEDEWRLVFDLLVEWPTIVSECQHLDQPKLHRITGFLSSLASTFSVYYRHSRVLNDGLVHMLPMMEARIHLLLAVKHVFLAAFSLLGIDAPTTM